MKLSKTQKNKLIAAPISFLLVFMVLIGIFAVYSPKVPEEVPKGQFSNYLPITRDYDFRLHVGYHTKVDFNDSEIMAIYRAINSFEFYGYEAPWAAEEPSFVRRDAKRNLRAANDEYEITIHFYEAIYDWYGAAVIFNNDPESQEWFTANRSALKRLYRLR